MTDTAGTQARRRRKTSADLLVVDTDVHVHESPAELAPYCDMPWRVALENVKDVPERYLDLPGLSPGGAGYEAVFPTAHDASRSVSDPRQLRQDLSDLGIDLAILFPDHLLKLPLFTQPEYAAALARAYNAWLADRWLADGNGFLGCIVACPQDPADAASEIRKYSAHPAMAAVYLPCAGLDPLWGDRRYDPIWEAVDTAGLAVMLHSVTVTHPVFPFNNHCFDTALARHACSHTFSIMSNLIHVLTAGIPVRFPDVRIAVTEAGVSWMPFLCNRMDKEYLEHRREVPHLEHRPSHYLKKVYVATQPIEEPEDLGDLVSLVKLYDGEDTTIFASDWPHHDFDHPMKLQQVPFSPEVKRKIFGENALRLLNIDAQGQRLDIRA